MQPGGREVTLARQGVRPALPAGPHPGHAFSRETILDRVWGWGFEGTTRTVDNYILALRQKLEPDRRGRAHPDRRQVGYRLDF